MHIGIKSIMRLTQIPDAIWHVVRVCGGCGVLDLNGCIKATAYKGQTFFATFFTFWRKARSLEDLTPDADQKKGRERELAGSLFFTCRPSL